MTTRRAIIVQDVRDHLSMMDSSSVFETQWSKVSSALLPAESLMPGDVPYCGVAASPRSAARWAVRSTNTARKVMTVEIVAHLPVPEGITDPDELRDERERVASRAIDEITEVVMRDHRRSGHAIKTTPVSDISNEGDSDTRYEAGDLVTIVMLFEIEYERDFTRNTMAHGEMYLSAQANTSIPVVGEFYDVEGTFSVGELLEFDMNTNGQLRYTGIKDRKFLVETTFAVISNENTVYPQGRITKNGSGITKSVMYSYAETAISDRPTLTLRAIVTLSQNDYVSIQVGSASGGSAALELTATPISMTAIQVPHF